MAEYVDAESVRQMLEDAQIITDGENNGYCTEDVDLSLIKREDVQSMIGNKNNKWVDGLITKVLEEVDGGTDDRYIRYADICDRVEKSIKEYCNAEIKSEK